MGKDNWVPIKESYLKSNKLTPNEKAVLGYLMTYRNCKEIFVSQKKIGEDVGIGRATVISILKNLEVKKYLRMVKCGNRKSIKYQLFLGRVVKNLDTGVQKSDIDVRNIDKGCTKSVLEPVQNLDTNKNKYNKINNNNIEEVEKKVDTSLNSPKDEGKKPRKATPPPRVKTSDCQEIIKYLNKKAGRYFDYGEVRGESNLKLVRVLFKKTYTMEEIKSVINNQIKKWINLTTYDKNNQEIIWREFLRPSTLFKPSNFTNYHTAAKEKKEQIINFKKAQRAKHDKERRNQAEMEKNRAKTIPESVKKLLNENPIKNPFSEEGKRRCFVCKKIGVRGDFIEFKQGLWYCPEHTKKEAEEFYKKEMR